MEPGQKRGAETTQGASKVDAGEGASQSPVESGEPPGGKREERNAPDGASSGGYEPDGYGRDDPYRKQEDVERERAAQQAAAAALSPAMGPCSGWRGAPPSKPRPPPKVLLGRGQEEVIEASTGARVIQPRQIPSSTIAPSHTPPSSTPCSSMPSCAARPTPTHDGEDDQPAPSGVTGGDSPRPKTLDSQPRPSETPSEGQVVDRPNKPSESSLETRSASDGRPSESKARGEPSSLSLQWLTPRRHQDGVAARGKPSAAAADADASGDAKKESTSAWAQPGQAGEKASPAGGGDDATSEQENHTNRHGKVPGSPPRSSQSRSARGSNGEGDQSHAPLSTFGKDTGRTFSSLFVPPGESGTEGSSSQAAPAAGGGSRGASQLHGQGGGPVELGRDWPEAGRGPTPREQKQIYDHKTGKMRNVEVRLLCILRAA